MDTIRINDIVQLSPEPGVTSNPMFAGCLLVVTEIRVWGVHGYVQALGENGKPGGQAYYRAANGTFAPCGGQASWVIDDGDGEAMNV